MRKELGASLRLVHAVPGAERQLADTGGDEFSLFLLDAARKDMAKLQPEAGTNLGGVGARRSSRQAWFIRWRWIDNADLLVIGRGVMHETFGRLRTQSYEVIRLSPCPVLSL